MDTNFYERKEKDVINIMLRANADNCSLALPIHIKEIDEVYYDDNGDVKVNTYYFLNDDESPFTDKDGLWNEVNDMIRWQLSRCPNEVIREIVYELARLIYATIYGIDEGELPTEITTQEIKEMLKS